MLNKDLMTRGGGGDDSWIPYVIDQNPHSNMYGMNKISLIKDNGKYYIKCPPRPSYDSTNDREFCCWLLISVVTIDDNPPNNQWTNIRIARLDTYPKSQNLEDQIKQQLFNQTQYSAYYPYSESLNCYVLGFIASYYFDYMPKWTFEFSDEIKAKIRNQENFDEVCTLSFVEQRVNKGAPAVFDYIDYTTGQQPMLLEPDLYTAKYYYQWDNNPGFVISKPDVINIAGGLDLSNAEQFNTRAWINWNTTVPLDYCPTTFYNTNLISGGLDTVYLGIVSNNQYYSADCRIPNYISPFSKLENVSFTARIIYTPNNSTSHDIDKLRLVDMTIHINNNDFAISGVKSFSDVSNDFEYIIISIFRYSGSQYLSWNTDLAKPNFGLPVEQLIY